MSPWCLIHNIGTHVTNKRTQHGNGSIWPAPTSASPSMHVPATNGNRFRYRGDDGPGLKYTGLGTKATTPGGHRGCPAGLDGLSVSWRPSSDGQRIQVSTEKCAQSRGGKKQETSRCRPALTPNGPGGAQQDSVVYRHHLLHYPGGSSAGTDLRCLRRFQCCALLRFHSGFLLSPSLPLRRQKTRAIPTPFRLDRPERVALLPCQFYGRA